MSRSQSDFSKPDLTYPLNGSSWPSARSGLGRAYLSGLSQESLRGSVAALLGWSLAVIEHSSITVPSTRCKNTFLILFKHRWSRLVSGFRILGSLSWVAIVLSSTQFWGSVQDGCFCSTVTTTLHPARGDTGMKEGMTPPHEGHLLEAVYINLFASLGPNLVTATHLTEEDMEIGSLFQVAICPARDICLARNLGFYYWGRRGERIERITSGLGHCYRKKSQEALGKISNSVIDYATFSKIPTSWISVSNHHLFCKH